ncbi:DUF885 domain-containing protein [Teredinibacter haidensis]|uniref:DUF885 domain-containing protein n=1 Tax=Teredinibacter haidensis TaxID=2731755 RepID=UPI000948FFBE|nr:DUF885 domain-containing protein [Teredinibacter haidensis]
MHLFRQPLLFLLFCIAFSPMAIASNNKLDEKANQLFDTVFDEWLARSPLWQTDLGIKTDYDKWDDLSETFQQQTHELHQQQLKRLHAIDRKQLSSELALSYRLLELQLTNDIEHFQWRYHGYPINQMFGWHTTVPSVLINQHTITSLNDAKAYISRLKAVPRLMDQVIDGLDSRAKKGIIAPKFVFPMVIEDSLNLLKGAPFDKGENSALLNDFTVKVNNLDLKQKQKQLLIADAEQALSRQLKPAYLKLIDTLKSLEKQADDRAGAWKFPKGEDFYNAALKRTTTTNLTANNIHQLGLNEVSRIHRDMQTILQQVKFDGSLQEFFTFMKEDKQFYHPNDQEGKAAYLARTQAVIAEIKSKLGELFITQPKADLIVKAVEAFREKSAGKAFYQSPPPDGSRPGIYYVNLYDMRNMPTYQLQALAYHEALPGHHMQLSIATELGDIPRFRKYSHFTAYIEGWGLYSELLPKEMGLYKDPYSDFGRLAMELWRACRLVVDTGLHAKKWTREQAIDYLVENTPNPREDARRAIERYIVMPSQATAYKIGMLKILELRETSKKELGGDFDIRAFHDRLLRLGAVPLNVLEEELL